MAPYSREFNHLKGKLTKAIGDDVELRARFEQVVEQARLTKESTLNVDVRRFDAPVDKIGGTVETASFRRVELAKYPDRIFHFSSVGSSMAIWCPISRLHLVPSARQHKLRSRTRNGQSDSLRLRLSHPDRPPRNLPPAT